MPANSAVLHRRIRFWLALFIIGLVLSGLTAFPLTWEVDLLVRVLHWSPLETISQSVGLTAWVERVRVGLMETDVRYPFIAYGTDWLAFAHLVIAAAFIGPWRDPLRNKWVIEWGIFNCIAVVPLALICGPLRGIPFGWRVIDCAFGVVGIWPLLIIHRAIRQLEIGQLETAPHPSAAKVL